MAQVDKDVRRLGPRERYGSLEGRSHWLADILRRRIWSYLPGSRLPGERELARQFRVSLRVARGATEMLAEEGLIISHRGQGSIVVREQTQAMPVRRVIAVISSDKQSSAAETQAVLLGAHEDCGRRGRPFEVIRSERLDLNQPESLLAVVRSGEPGRGNARAGAAGLPMEVGWMFVRLAPPPHVLETWKIWRLPLVLVNDNANLAGHTVNPDGQGAVYHATERALLLGHRRVAFIGRAPHAQPGGIGEAKPAAMDDIDPLSLARWHGFELACQRYHLPVENQLVWPLTAPETQDVQRYLLERLSAPGEGPRPTAIIAADQRIACDVLTVCDRLGISVPQQISIISGGLERRELPRDLVSRISRSSEGRPEKIGQLATSLLMDAHLSAAPVKMLADFEWIDGGSLGPAPR